MPRIQLAPPAYELDAAEVCFSSGLLVQAIRAPGTGTVSIATAVGGGSAAETDETRGAAHLVEHLWFRARPGGGATVRDRVDALWWQGETHQDATVYTTVGAAADLQALLALEGARLVDPLAGVTEADLAAERDIVASELLWRGEHSDRAALRYLDQALWPEAHPYAAGMTPLDAARALDLADAKAFAASYEPRNTSIRIEGDFEWSALQGLLEAGLPESIRGGARPGCKRARSAEPPPMPRDTKLARLEAPIWKPRLYVAWSLPAAWGKDDTEMQVAVDLLEDDVWAGMPWVRGVSELDDLSVGCELIRGRLASQAVCVVQLPASADLPGAYAAVRRELGNQWSPAFAQSRRERIADSGAHRYVEAFAGLDSQAAQSDRAFSSWLGRIDPVEPFLDSLVGIDEASVAKFAERWLNADRAVAIALVPTTARAESGAGWSGQARIEAPPAPDWHPPAPNLGALQAQTLPNGLDLWVLPRPESVYLGITSIVWSGGWSTNPARGSTEVLEALHRYVLNVGLSDLRRDVGLTIGSSYGSRAIWRDTYGAAGNLDLHLWLQRALLDGQDLDFSERQSLLDPPVEAAFAAFREQPWTTSDHLRVSHLLPGDPAGQPWWEGVRAARHVAASDVYSWQRTTYRPENGTLLVVGPVDPTVVAASAGGFLDWKAKGKPVVATPPALPAVPARKVYVMAADATLTDVMLTCRVPARTDANAAAFDVLAAVVDRGLWQTLREDGHIYGYTQEWSFPDARVGLLTIRARTAPEDAAPALWGILGVLKLAQQGPSAEVLANARLSAKGAAAWRFSSADAAWSALHVALQEGRSAASLASPGAEKVDAAALAALLGDCVGHEAATFVGAAPVGRWHDAETVDWAAYGATLAESLR